MIDSTVGAICCVVFATVAFAGWWSGSVQHEAQLRARREQMEALAQMLTEVSEHMLLTNDLSALRRVVMNASSTYRLTRCQITLMDGRILADSRPSSINVTTLPDRWPSAPLDHELTDSQAGRDSLVVQQLLTVPNRGGALLRVASEPPAASPWWAAQSGIAICGACTLAVLTLIYRRLRRSLLGVSMIRESLYRRSLGEMDTEVLSLHPSLGPEAVAWNQLLQESRDLSATIAAERAKAVLGPRRDARSALDGIVDTLPIGVVVLDSTGCVKTFNGAAAALLSIDRDAAIGQGISALIDHPDLKLAAAAIVEGQLQRRTIELDRRQQQDGGGIVRVHIRPTRRDDAAGALLTLEDVTQQRVADAARNSFVAQATHELRAPLTNMRLALEEAMGDDAADPVLLGKHLNLINQEARRLERLVSEMLSVAEIEAGSMRLRNDDVKLERLFEEVRHDYAKQAEEKQVALTLELPPKLPTILGDRDKLAAALHNLVSNAIKYTPAGGKVTVTARHETQMLVIDVADTGFGIAEADRPRIFEKFFRARDERVAKITGTGLGLALAKEVAKLHGGDLSFTSELNQGTTFTLSLPALPPQQGASVARAA